MPHAYYMAIQSTIGRPEVTQSPPNAGVFSRPDSEVASSTVVTTAPDPVTGGGGSTINPNDDNVFIGTQK
jgi:hypothetical protein